MGAKEKNKYKADLASAKEVIDAQRTAVTGESGMGHAIKTKITAHEGWVCDTADEWITDFIAKCTPVANEFDTAWDEVDAEWSSEPAEVDENDWRGNRYGQVPHGHQNIPI